MKDTLAKSLDLQRLQCTNVPEARPGSDPEARPGSDPEARPGRGPGSRHSAAAWVL